MISKDTVNAAAALLKEKEYLFHFSSEINSPESIVVLRVNKIGLWEGPDLLLHTPVNVARSLVLAMIDKRLADIRSELNALGIAEDE